MIVDCSYNLVTINRYTNMRPSLIAKPIKICINVIITIKKRLYVFRMCNVPLRVRATQEMFDACEICVYGWKNTRNGVQFQTISICKPNVKYVLNVYALCTFMIMLQILAIIYSHVIFWMPENKCMLSMFRTLTQQTGNVKTSILHMPRMLLGAADTVIISLCSSNETCNAHAHPSSKRTLCMCYALRKKNTNHSFIAVLKQCAIARWVTCW